MQASLARAVERNVRAQVGENQLAVQFLITDLTDFDSLIHIEDTLTLAFLEDKAAVVDGHDIGQGKFHVFLFAKAPLSTVVDRVKVALDELGVLNDATIAHRLTMQSTYSVVWPEQYRGIFEL